MLRDGGKVRVRFGSDELRLQALDLQAASDELRLKALDLQTGGSSGGRHGAHARASRASGSTKAIACCSAPGCWVGPVSSYAWEALKRTQPSRTL